MPPKRLKSVSKFVWIIMNKCSFEPRSVELHYRTPRPYKAGACVKAPALAGGWVAGWGLVGEWVVVKAANRK